MSRLTEVLKIFLLKRKADKLARKTGIQQFIIKWRGQVVILGKDKFTYMRQHGLFAPSFTATQLKEMAFYYTGK